MSVQRSPPRSGLNSARSDSYPNLTNKGQPSDETDLSQITFRNKRKLTNEGEEIKVELSEMKNEFIEMRKQMSILQNQMSEMMTYLASSNSMQVENFNKLNEDISTIKEQICNIKSTTENLTEEQNKLKSDIRNIKKFNSTTENKINQLESNFQRITSNSSKFVEGMTIQTQEKLMIELNERNMRCNNIVISGLAETMSINPEERREYDKSAFLSIIKPIYTDCPEPEKIFRVGKYIPGKTRLLKVCFKSREIAKYILRNKQNIKESNIKIFSDQTPQQQAYIKALKEEMESRSKNGELNLGIKYFKGVPKIITSVPKN